MQPQFQLLETDAHWAEAARVSSSYWPEDPVTGEQLRLYALEHPDDKFMQRYLVLEEGRSFAYVRVMEAYWYAEPCRASFGISLARDLHPSRMGDLYAACLEDVLKRCHSAGMSKQSVYIRSDDDFPVAPLERMGFEIRQRNPFSTLDIDAFDGAKFERHRARLEAKGYEFMSLPTLEERLPEDWLRIYYDWDMAVSEDIPMTGQFEAFPFETYTKMMLNPTNDRGGYFLALMDGQVAAATELRRNLVDPSIAMTGLTGTRREDRRQGLASVVKAAALQNAKRIGVKRVFTDNEENNPMYGLNCDLGFRRVRDIVEWVRG